MINDSDFFWLAGIIDGEGYLTTNKRQGVHKKRNNGNGQYSFITRIGVGNTDVELIKKVSEIFYVLGAKFYFTLHTPNKKFVNAMDYLSINVEGYRSTKKILDAIIDKLHSNKKRQAKKILEYIEYRLSMFQKRNVNGTLCSKIKKEQFESIDKKFEESLRYLKHYQILPSTTRRKASTPLEIIGGSKDIV